MAYTKIHGLFTKVHLINGADFQRQAQSAHQAIHYGNSGYSDHILNSGHTYENIASTMNVIKKEHLNRLVITISRKTVIT